ncbi:hypothetical protein BUE76_11750 [Cnuella takakiae]|nr:hypothetical protein BUE76_11750 [Cnuella takakiae]
MLLPYTFTLREGKDQVQVSWLTNHIYEFNILSENGCAEQFLYDLSAPISEKECISQQSHIRSVAVAHFIQGWLDR